MGAFRKLNHAICGTHYRVVVIGDLDGFRYFDVPIDLGNYVLHLQFSKCPTMLRCQVNTIRTYRMKNILRLHSRRNPAHQVGSCPRPLHHRDSPRPSIHREYSLSDLELLPRSEEFAQGEKTEAEAEVEVDATSSK